MLGILSLNFHKMGEGVPGRVFWDENSQTRRRFSDSFLTAQNLGDNCLPRHDATVDKPATVQIVCSLSKTYLVKTLLYPSLKEHLLK